MTKEELLNVRGGSTFTSASFLNALARGANVLYELGTTVGKCIKLFISGKKCS